MRKWNDLVWNKIRGDTQQQDDSSVPLVLRLKSSSDAFMWSSLNTLPANWTFITPGGSSLIGPLPSYRSLNSEWPTCSFRGNIRVSLTDRWTSRQLFSSCWCFNKAKLSVVVTFWLSSVSWDMTNIHTAQWEAERCRPGFVSVKERLESPDAGRTSWVDERIHEGGFSFCFLWHDCCLWPRIQLYLVMTRSY